MTESVRNLIIQVDMLPSNEDTSTNSDYDDK